MNQKDYHKALYQEVCLKHKIDSQMKIEHDGYYLTVSDYLVAVSYRDELRRILPAIQSMLDAQTISGYLHRAVHRIIMETLSKNPEYVEFYKKRLKKIG